jgi:hypothetical protein
MSASTMLAGTAHAGQTFTVNNVGDPVEGDPSFGFCYANLCTLRTAITVANSTNTRPVGNNAQLLIERDGVNAGPAATGLRIEADDVTVRGSLSSASATPASRKTATSTRWRATT